MVLLSLARHIVAMLLLLRLCLHYTLCVVVGSILMDSILSPE